MTAFEYDAIRDKTQRTLVGFLTAEIDLGLTLTRSAVNAYDAGRTEYFSEAKEKATKLSHSEAIRGPGSKRQYPARHRSAVS